LKIEDLHFHDLRHEGTSRLFEAGLTIEKVALVTGHKDSRFIKSAGSAADVAMAYNALTAVAR